MKYFMFFILVFTFTVHADRLYPAIDKRERSSDSGHESEGSRGGNHEEIVIASYKEGSQLPMVPCADLSGTYLCSDDLGAIQYTILQKGCEGMVSSLAEDESNPAVVSSRNWGNHRQSVPNSHTEFLALKLVITVEVPQAGIVSKTTFRKIDGSPNLEEKTDILMSDHEPKLGSPRVCIRIR